MELENYIKIGELIFNLWYQNFMIFLEHFKQNSNINLNHGT